MIVPFALHRTIASSALTAGKLIACGSSRGSGLEPTLRSAATGVSAGLHCRGCQPQARGMLTRISERNHGGNSQSYALNDELSSCGWEQGPNYDKNM